MERRKFAGQRFGNLIAIEITNRKLGTNKIWKCRCDCGKYVEVSTGNLGNHVNSCGCLRAIPIIGKIFNRLTVIKRVGSKNREPLYLCQCICGKQKIVPSKQIRYSITKSCGCLHRELVINRNKSGVVNLRGRRFGKLRPIQPLGIITKSTNMIWQCLCDCGNLTNVNGGNLVSGGTSSCGCNKQRGIETSIEKIIRLSLVNHGISFKQEYSVKKISTADFYLPDSNTLIYCDGDYWHRKLKRNGKSRRLIDYKINKKLKLKGYKVLRFWEKQIRKNPQKCEQKILEIIQ